MDFIIRPWRLSDVKSLVLHANNINVAKKLTDKFPHPYTNADGVAFINFAMQDQPNHIFAIEVNGNAVGGIGVHPQTDIFCKNAELGYWLSESFWGLGIISKAIHQVLGFAFSNYEIDRVFARPFGNNLGSQKALEKNNFLLEGKFEKTLFKNGEYHDELVYAIRREQWKKNIS